LLDQAVEGHRSLCLALLASLLMHACCLLTVLPDAALRIAVPSRVMQGALRFPEQVPPGRPVMPLPAQRSESGSKQAAPPAAQPPNAARTPTWSSTVAAKPAPPNLAKIPPQHLVPPPEVSPPEHGRDLSAVGEGVSADALREYRVSLAIAARRFKRYPVLALERGWEGTAEVAVGMTSWQQRPQPALVRSSGHSVLDEQALSMIEQASVMTVLPDSLKGRDFRFVLPIEFIREGVR